MSWWPISGEAEVARIFESGGAFSVLIFSFYASSLTAEIVEELFDDALGSFEPEVVFFRGKPQQLVHPPAYQIITEPFSGLVGQRLVELGPSITASLEKLRSGLTDGGVQLAISAQVYIQVVIAPADHEPDEFGFFGSADGIACIDLDEAAMRLLLSWGTFVNFSMIPAVMDEWSR